MLPWLVQKMVKSPPAYSYTCHYFLIKTAATSGCMASKPYWMTFVDTTCNLDGSSALKYYLNPIPLINSSSYISEKTLAAFQIPGLENVLPKCQAT